MNSLSVVEVDQGTALLATANEFYISMYRYLPLAKIEAACYCDARYAVIAIMSSMFRFATTGAIISLSRVPACMS